MLSGQSEHRLTIDLTLSEARAIVVALELRRVNNEWHSATLRDSAAYAETKIARLVREVTS